jgi:2',3'-cyclic-nucleotide 2'-phosphodiesterase (5'-nucleotidase family)
MNRLSWGAKIGIKLCPILTARSPWTKARTLEAMANAKKYGDLSCWRKGFEGTMVKLRDGILTHKNTVGMSDDSLDNLDAKKITFVHSNDNHSSYNEDAPGQNPLSRKVGYIKRLRKNQRNVVATDAGDIFEKGSVAELTSEGKATLEVFKAVAKAIKEAEGLDKDKGIYVFTIGNHDFAWDVETVFELLSAEDVHVLATNLEYVGNDAAMKARFDALNLKFISIEKDGVKYGFFGMFSQAYSELDELIKGGNGFYPGIFKTNHDYVELAKKIMAQYRHQVDVMVMVNHIGLKADKEVSEVPAIDKALSGHSHSKLLEGVVDADGTIIGQAGAYGKNFIHLDVIVDTRKKGKKVVNHRYKLIKNDPETLKTNDPKLARQIKGIVDHYAPEALKKFVKVSRDLNKDEVAAVVANAAIHRPNVDAVLVDKKTVWQEWKAGALTQQDLADTFKVERQRPGGPGFSSFYIVEVSGEDLSKMRSDDKHAGRWVYGGPEQLDPSKTYRLALSKKQAMNVEEYFKHKVDVKIIKPACEMWEAVYEYGVYRNQQNLHIDADLPLAA